MTGLTQEERDYRARTARAALDGYDRWVTDETGTMPLDFEAVGNAVSCAGWLLEMLTASGPRVTGQANTAIKSLGARQLRDVLSALAVRCPAAVLDAIAETGH